MRLTRFYQLCVAIPLAFPLVTFPLSRLMESDVSIVARSAQLAAVLAASALVGGVPYILFALPLLWVFRNKTASAYTRFSLVAPIAFAFFVFSFFFAFAAFTTRPGLKLDIGLHSGGFYALWSLGVGYFYVGVAHALRVALSRFGLVHSEGAV